jgi:hypothetical protein
MEQGFLDHWAYLLEPPGEACGESQRSTVRLSVFTVDDPPQAPETHTFRGLRSYPELLVPNETRSLAGFGSGEHPTERHCSTFPDRWLTDWLLGRWLRSPPCRLPRRRPPL